MIAASELAGFVAAHAVWSVSDGDTLIPMLACADESGERTLTRLVHEQMADAVELGKQRLAENATDATDAVLAYDARITVDDEQLDAVVLEMRVYFSPEAEAVIAVPYTPPTDGPFRVHRPKVLNWSNCDDFDFDQAISAFFEGVAAHDKGAAIWNDCLDESK